MLVFPEITKTYYKMQVPKAALKTRLFTLLNIHFDKNTKVQKQNDTEVRLSGFRDLLQ